MSKRDSSQKTSHRSMAVGPVWGRGCNEWACALGFVCGGENILGLHSDDDWMCQAITGLHTLIGRITRCGLHLNGKPKRADWNPACPLWTVAASASGDGCVFQCQSVLRPPRGGYVGCNITVACHRGLSSPLGYQVLPLPIYTSQTLTWNVVFLGELSYHKNVSNYHFRLLSVAWGTSSFLGQCLFLAHLKGHTTSTQ